MTGFCNGGRWFATWFLAMCGLPVFAATYLHTQKGLSDVAQEPYPAIWQQGDHSVFFAFQKKFGLVASPLGMFDVQNEAVPGARLSRSNHWVDGQYHRMLEAKSSQQVCWSGLHQYVSDNPTLCRDYTWWGPATVCFNTGEKAQVAINSRVIDGASCKITGNRDLIRSDYKRFVGLQFVKSSSDGFIKTQTVGSQTEHKVRVGWDYSDVVKDAYVDLYVTTSGGNQILVGKYGLRGAYEHAIATPALFDIITEVVNPKLGVIHRDRVSADFRQQSRVLTPELPDARVSAAK